MALRPRRGRRDQVAELVEDRQAQIGTVREAVQPAGLVFFRGVKRRSSQLECEPERLDGVDPDGATYLAAAEPLDLVGTPAFVRVVGGRERKADPDSHRAVGIEDEPTLC